MNIVEALKKSRKVRRTTDHGNEHDFTSHSGEVIWGKFYIGDLLADDWEPILPFQDLRDEIAKQIGNHPTCSGGFCDAHKLVRRALNEYEERRKA